MARRSRMSILKRQRELKKSEKAARKRAKRHGQPLDEPTEPRPTRLVPDPGDDSAADDTAAETPAEDGSGSEPETED